MRICFRGSLAKGIVLELKDNGDVYMQNLLEKNSVFAQSSFLTLNSPNKASGCDIYRVLPAAELKVNNFHHNFVLIFYFASGIRVLLGVWKSTQPSLFVGCTSLDVTLKRFCTSSNL